MTKALRHTGLIFFVLSITLLNLNAQVNGVKVDSSSIEVTYFEEDIKERYNSSDFDYSVNDTGGVNLIQRALRKFFNWLGDMFGFDVDFLDYQTMEYIVYGLLALGALYLLINFLLQTKASSVFRNPEKDIEDFKYVEENLNQINFEDLIKKALQDSNYRLATRYLYLSALKTLTNSNIIDWHYDKTNSDYISEINDNTIKDLFKRISYIYDYVWYGEFPIDEQRYQSNTKDFTQLLNAINR